MCEFGVIVGGNGHFGVLNQASGSCRIERPKNDRPLAPVRAEDGLRTLLLGVLTTPVGVVDKLGFGHDWIVNAFAARQVLFASDVEAVGR